MQDSKTYLNVPYAQKDAAKALGAKWDPAKKLWYAPSSLDISLFSKWNKQPGTHDTANTKSTLTSGTSSKNVALGITTYGKNKDLSSNNGDEPPWD